MTDHYTSAKFRPHPQNPLRMLLYTDPYILWSVLVCARQIKVLFIKRVLVVSCLYSFVVQLWRRNAARINYLTFDLLTKFELLLFRSRLSSVSLYKMEWIISQRLREVAGIYTRIQGRVQLVQVEDNYVKKLAPSAPGVSNETTRRNTPARVASYLYIPPVACRPLIPI